MPNLICSNGYVCRMCVITTWMEMSCVYNIITPSDLYQLSLQLIWIGGSYYILPLYRYALHVWNYRCLTKPGSQQQRC